VWQYVGPLLGVGFGYLISDKVWDRQKQWELRRDLIFEAVRALGELDYSLIELDAAYSVQVSDQKDLEANKGIGRHCKAMGFIECDAKMYRAMFAVRLVVGKELLKALTERVNEMRSLSIRVRSGDSVCLYSPETRKRHVEGMETVLSVARKELKNKYVLSRVTYKN
jgi:hypothetical protein